MTTAGFPHGLARSLAAVTAILGGLYLLARVSSDVAPEIDGDTLELLVELRPPPTWQPTTSTLAGNNSCALTSRIGSGRRRRNNGALDFQLATQTDTRWTVPCLVSLHSSRTPLRLEMQLGKEPAVEFTLPIPAHPTPQNEQWSDWQTAQTGYTYRVKVKRYAVANAERQAEAQAQMAQRQHDFEQLTDSSPLKNWLPFATSGNTAAQQHLLSDNTAFAKLLNDADLTVIRQSLELLQSRAEIPAPLHTAVIAAGRHVLPLIADVHRTPDERTENQARNFATLWQRVAERTGAPMAAEQNEIHQAAAYATSGPILELAHAMQIAGQ
jgi:hypothetical protein